MEAPGQQQSAGVVGKEKQAEMREIHSKDGRGRKNPEGSNRPRTTVLNFKAVTRHFPVSLGIP